jgi:hypothetical protein
MPSLNTKLASAPNTTANYVLKATTSTTIGNSLIYDDGTNVGIGTSTPAAALHITGAIGAAPAANGVMLGVQSNYAILHLNGTSGTGSLIDFSTSGVDYKGRIEYDNTSNWMRFGTDGAERMRITSTGNVGIGTSNPTRQLFVNSTAFFDNNGDGSTTNPSIAIGSTSVGISYLAGGNLALLTGATERMRITSAGLIGIGGASSGWTLAVNSTSSNNSSTPHQLAIFGNNVSGAIKGYIYIGSSAGIDWLVGKDTSGAGDGRFNLSLYTGEQRMILYTNGNYSFAGSNVSDIRLKSNINTLNVNALEKINQFIAKSYYMTDNPEQIRYGFIAQEIRDIVPDLVAGEEKEQEYLGLDYNGVLALAIKAIQELNQKVNDQQQTINSLINR